MLLCLRTREMYWAHACPLFHSFNIIKIHLSRLDRLVGITKLSVLLESKPEIESESKGMATYKCLRDCWAIPNKSQSKQILKKCNKMIENRKCKFQRRELRIPTNHEKFPRNEGLKIGTSNFNSLQYLQF